MSTTASLRSEILTLINKKGLKGHAAEIGVKQGHFSEMILQRWLGERLYMVDAWRYLPGIEDIAQVPNPKHAEFMREARARTAAYGDRALMISALSTVAAELIPNRSLDWVYIDAAHDYKHVTEDLKTWAPKVKRGGLIWGDDYLNGRYFNTVFEVISAVNDFFGVKNVNSNPPCKAVSYIPQWWVEV